MQAGVLVHLSRSVSRRSALAVVAVGPLAAAALPAGATTTTTPAHGSATSTLTVLHVTVNSDSVAAGAITAVAANTRSPHTADLVVTPLAYNFASVGKSGTVGRTEV